MVAVGTSKWTSPLVVEDVLESARYMGLPIYINPNTFGINYLIGNRKTGYMTMYDNGRDEPKIKAVSDPSSGNADPVYTMYTVESRMVTLLPSMTAEELLERGNEVDAIRTTSASLWTPFESAEVAPASNMIRVTSRTGNVITYSRTTKVHYKRKKDKK